MRVIVVAGARPNFVKIAPLVPTLRAAGIQTDIAHTGQHYDALMSDIFFDDLSIPSPSWSLEVGSGSHAQQTARAMERLEELFAAERPDAVIVVGDVNSTLAGALAAAKLSIPIVHLESGLRSWDTSMPEEVNRIVTDRLSSLLLTPSEDADAHLRAEGAADERIHFVGNIMIESLLTNMDAIDAVDIEGTYGVKPGEFAVATCHRAENTDDPEILAGIMDTLGSLEMPVLLFVHPRTRASLAEWAIDVEGGSLVMHEPVGYLQMIALQKAAALVVTDSGGMQEEACVLGTPCVTMRRNTERPITVEVGANRVVAARPDAIRAGVADALASPRGWRAPDRWDASVSSRIAEVLLATQESGFPTYEIGA